MADALCICLDIEIPRPRKNKKRNLQNDARIRTCIDQYNHGPYWNCRSHQPQSERSLRCIPVHVGRQQRRRRWRRLYTPSATATPSVTEDAATAIYSVRAWCTCEVCLTAPRSAAALVPCEHSRCCSNCAEAVINIIQWLSNLKNTDWASSACIRTG